MKLNRQQRRALSSKKKYPREKFLTDRKFRSHMKQECSSYSELLMGYVIGEFKSKNA